MSCHTYRHAPSNRHLSATVKPSSPLYIDKGMSVTVTVADQSRLDPEFTSPRFTIYLEKRILISL